MLFFSFARGETKEEIVLEVVFLKFHIGRVLPLPSERRFVEDNLMKLRHILHTLLELLKREIKGQASGRSSSSTMFNEYSFHERCLLSCLLRIKICRFHQIHICKYYWLQHLKAFQLSTYRQSLIFPTSTNIPLPISLHPLSLKHNCTHPKSLQPPRCRPILILNSYTNIRNMPNFPVAASCRHAM